jgi:hypothetical protein
MRAECREYISDPGYHQIDPEQNTRHDDEGLLRPCQHDDAECDGQNADKKQQLPCAASKLVQWTFEKGLFAGCHGWLLIQR